MVSVGRSDPLERLRGILLAGDSLYVSANEFVANASLR